MLFGSVWEFAVPAAFALATVTLWFRRPYLRLDGLFRLFMIGSVSVTVAEVIMGGFILAWVVSGGMQEF
jgi:hypothetical protein